MSGGNKYSCCVPFAGCSKIARAVGLGDAWVGLLTKDIYR